MSAPQQRVFAAISGGVDSSTAAALLLAQGYPCQAIFMITNDNARHAQADAQAIADKLGIKLHVLDLRSRFEELLLDYFCSEYKIGRTPNPCVLCNRHIKFGTLWDFARANGATFLATGHYARIIGQENNVGLYESAEVSKDQSYALAQIDKNVLGHVIFPLGDYSKSLTRRTARQMHLGTEDKEESQEICFIPDNDYVRFLEQRCPEIVRRGDIVDSSGKVLGKHNGVHRFTIGQRRGLRVAMGKPYYVCRIDAKTNTVVLGPKQEVMHRRLLAGGANWLIDDPPFSFQAKVKIRYNDLGSPAVVTRKESCVLVEFDEPKLAITPGQLAVFYIRQDAGWQLAGSAWIDEPLG